MLCQRLPRSSRTSQEAGQPPPRLIACGRGRSHLVSVAACAALVDSAAPTTAATVPQPEIRDFKEHVLEVHRGAANPLCGCAGDDFDGDGVDDVLVIGAAAGHHHHRPAARRRRRRPRRAARRRRRRLRRLSGDRRPRPRRRRRPPVALLRRRRVRLPGRRRRRLRRLRSRSPSACKIRTTTVTDVDGDGRRDLLVLGSLSEQPAVEHRPRRRLPAASSPHRSGLAVVPGLDRLAARASSLAGCAATVRSSWSLRRVGAQRRPRAGHPVEPAAGPFVRHDHRPAPRRPLAARPRRRRHPRRPRPRHRPRSPSPRCSAPDLSEGPYVPTSARARPDRPRPPRRRRQPRRSPVPRRPPRPWRGVGDGRFTAAVQLEFSADVIEVDLPDLNADWSGRRRRRPVPRRRPRHPPPAAPDLRIPRSHGGPRDARGAGAPRSHGEQCLARSVPESLASLDLPPRSTARRACPRAPGPTSSPPPSATPASCLLLRPMPAPPALARRRLARLLARFPPRADTLGGATPSTSTSRNYEFSATENVIIRQLVDAMQLRRRGLCSRWAPSS